MTDITNILGAMSWLQKGAAFFIVMICVLLMIVILLQRGRGGGVSSAFGGGGGTAAFGAKTGDVFTLITVIGASFFFIATVTANYWFTPKLEESLPSADVQSTEGALQEEESLPPPAPAPSPTPKDAGASTKTETSKPISAVEPEAATDQKPTSSSADTSGGKESAPANSPPSEKDDDKPDPDDL